MTEYDITDAFRAIEDELIASMMRNMKRHCAEETAEGYEWSMWQAEQLKALEKYKKENRKKYSRQFRDINTQIAELIRQARAEGNMQQEIDMLEAIKNGFTATKISRGMSAEFFRLNDRKLEALIEATTNDMQKAETAVLRMANDQYRKVIYNAQVYANTGAGTYEKAVDMAAKDFLAAGINCIEYANGARHTLSDYADMAIRTASKRAYLAGEGEKRQEWGVTTVIMAKRGNPCPKCLPFVGKVLIDDVWSGGHKDGVDPETGKKYPLMSYAISKGLYHPRCKDSHTTYFPGISTADDTWTKEELEEIGLQAKEEAKQQYAERQAEKYDRLAKYSLDEENRKKYQSRAKQWKDESSAKKVNFVDVANQLFKSTESPTPNVELLSEFVVDGVNYAVDNVNVKQNNSLRELEVAELLKNVLGGEIKLVPEIKGKYKNVKTPDYIFNGERYDLKELTGISKDAIRNAIHKKREQADNFVIDITKCKLEMEEINRQAESVFTSYNTGFVKTIILVKGNEILRILQRK